MTLALAGFCAFSFTSKQVYYADQPNPPQVMREPPFESTRRQVKKDFYYLNIRYPRQGIKDQDSSVLTMKFSVGNECDDLILFQVARLRVSAKGKPVKLQPVFYNESSQRTEKGWAALEKYTFRVPSHEHRTVEVDFLPESLKHKELFLEMAVLVTSPDKKDMTRQEIKLYRGHYQQP